MKSCHYRPGAIRGPPQCTLDCSISSVISSAASTKSVICPVSRPNYASPYEVLSHNSLQPAAESLDE